MQLYVAHDVLLESVLPLNKEGDTAQMEHVAEIIRDLLIFIAAMMALFVLFIVVVSMMPHDNPLKRVLTALTYRIGATAVAGLVAIPIEPIPVIDGLYDIGVPIALIWYWFTFLRDARGMMRSPHQSGPSPHRSITKSDDRSMH
jgi:hypothetical protein